MNQNRPYAVCMHMHACCSIQYPVSGVFKNNCVFMKTGVFLLTIGVLLIKNTKINNKKADHTPARPERSVGFFIVYFCVFNEKQADLNKKPTDFYKNKFIFNHTYKEKHLFYNMCVFKYVCFKICLF